MEKSHFRSHLLRARQQTGLEDGYTLLEILVVLGITVLLAAVVGPRVIQHFGKAKHDTARIQLNNIATAIELYYMDLGKYPAPEPGLQALVTKPSSETRWSGPYLQKAEGLVDPWQNAYRYAFPGQHGAYDLYSLGGDNAEGGDGDDADIRNW